MSLLLRVQNLQKAYPRLLRRRDHVHAFASLLLRGRLPEALKRPVLSDINLEVARGCSLGIIGENGAGKSTLLKLLTGVLSPDAGRIEIKGSIGALLELGAGFHPELSGRANIELAGQLAGLSARTIRMTTDQIIEFADIGEAIDRPLKHYSSGMVVRLGFAVLATRRPDLLITDEVLAVGDESFQKKCVSWTEDYLKAGGTLLLVSHSIYHVQKLCQQAIWLKAGRIEKAGDVFAVTQAYLAYHEQKSAQGAVSRQQDQALHQVRSVRINGDQRELGVEVAQGDRVEVEADLYAPDCRAPQILIGLVRADGTPVFGFGSEFDPAPSIALAPDLFRFRAELSDLALLPGHYQVRVSVLDHAGVRLFDTVTHELVVTGASRLMGLVRLPYRWLP